MNDDNGASNGNNNNFNANETNENINTANSMSSENETPTQDEDDMAALKRAAADGNPSGDSPVLIVPASCVETDGGSSHSRNNNSRIGRKLVGKNVETTFGIGVVVDFRSSDGVYEIQLKDKNGESNSHRGPTTLYSVQPPKVCEKTQAEIANQLNVAYEALEKMRRLNLDVLCHESGIPAREVDYDMCTQCLLEKKGFSKPSNVHVRRMQKILDTANAGIQSANAGIREVDSQINQSISKLNNFFLPPSQSNSNMASRISASLQESSTLNARNRPSSSSRKPAPSTSTTQATTTANANNSTAASASAQSSPATAARGSDAKLNPKQTDPAKGKPSGNGPISGSNGNSAIANGNRPTRAVKAKRQPQNQKNISRTAVGASFQTNAPVESPKRMPGLKSLWGKIQSLPQPAVPKAPPRKAPPSNNPTSSTQWAASSSFSSASLSANVRSPSQIFASNPMKGLMNSKVTTTIFGDNRIKEEGSSADPNVIMHNRISSSSSSLSDALSPPKKPAAQGAPSIQNLINRREKANTQPCLICGSPSCPSCSSPSFRKEGITLCLKCERLFELDFIVDCVSTSDTALRAERIEYMVDCYDRCLLLLQYSKQFVEQIATSLEDQKNKQDIIGLASSSVGVLSGVLGIAAAASILTPAGPPLLIASLFFGGGATTVQSGTECLNYLSEPRKLTDRIIALHGMSLSILRVTSTLRDAMMRDHIRTDVYEVEPTAAGNKVKQSYQKNKTNIVMGSNFGRSLTLGGVGGARVGMGLEAGATGAVVGAVAAGETSVVAGATAASTAGAAGARGATAMSRAGTAAARTVRFARFAGGALSAAVLVMEANAIHSTVKSIKAGSPSEKAETLRNLVKEIDEFPSTTALDEECQSYLAALAARPEPPIEVDAISVSDADSNNGEIIIEADCQQVDSQQLCAPGAVIVDRVGSDEALSASTNSHPTAAATPVSTSGSVVGSPSFLRGSSSLFQRMRSRRDDRRDAAAEVVAVAVDDTTLGESNFSLVL